MLSERSFVPSPAVSAQALRAFCRGRGVSACRNHGLARLLTALPTRSRLGEVAPTVAELLLRLGVVGSPSALGAALAAGLGFDDPVPASTTGEASTPQSTDNSHQRNGAGARFSDAAMIWTTEGGGCRVLRLHRIVLCLRAPLWAQLLLEHHLRRSQAVPGQPRGDVAAPDATGADAEPAGARAGEAYIWHVSAADASQLTYEACCCLYRLAVSGHATVTSPLTPRALVNAARALDSRQLLTEPPCDASGRGSLSLSLACGADAPEPSLLSVGATHQPPGDVTFLLSDGVVTGHRALLAARSDYFNRMLRWEENGGCEDSCGSSSVRGGAVSGECLVPTHPSAACGAAAVADSDACGPSCATPELDHQLHPPPRPQTVRVSGGSCASFRALLRYLYSGSVAPAGSEVDAHTSSGLGANPNTARRPHLASPAPTLRARHCLELSSFARRYMLDDLVRDAAPMVRAAMAASEVVPALMLCQAEGFVDEAQDVFAWAVDHYEEMVRELERGVGSGKLGGNHPGPPALCESEAHELIEQLRAGMLRTRYGL